MTQVTAAESAPASEPLRKFLQVARGAGLRVSAAEGIDAARAVDIIGYTDRTRLKDTLGLVLAKSPDEKALYDEAFENYFKREEFARETREEQTQKKSDAPPQGGSPGSEGGEGGGGGGESSQALGDLLENDDRAGLAASMEVAAREAGIDKIRLMTQKAGYARQMLMRMGLQEVRQRIEELRASLSPEDNERAQKLEKRLDQLWDAARDYAERALLVHAQGESERTRERLLRATRLANIEPHQLDKMRTLVRQMAKRLATRYAATRRKHLRGHLDVRRTLRRNMGWGGVPFITVWKQKKIEKARVMVLCDVSGSVAWIAQFLLMFLYALTEVLSDIRSYAYSDSLIEVSDIMEKEPIDDAIAHVLAAMGFGNSNYGAAFEDFENGWMPQVTNKTTVIILGDARGNETDPRTDILARVSKRAKKIIWLNPEFKSSWGAGDSDIFRYAPYCSLVRVCSTLNDLDRVITDLLDDAA